MLWKYNENFLADSHCRSAGGLQVIHLRRQNHLSDLFGVPIGWGCTGAMTAYAAP